MRVDPGVGGWGSSRFSTRRLLVCSVAPVTREARRVSLLMDVLLFKEHLEGRGSGGRGVCVCARACVGVHHFLPEMLSVM